MYTQPEGKPGQFGEGAKGSAGTGAVAFFFSTWPWQCSHSSSESSDEELSPNLRGLL